MTLFGPNAGLPYTTGASRLVAKVDSAAVQDGFAWGVVLPALLLTVLAVLPYALPQARDSELGQWFPRGNRISQIVVIVLALAIIILTILSTFQTAST